MMSDVYISNFLIRGVYRCDTLQGLFDLSVCNFLIMMFENEKFAQFLASRS